MHILDAESIFSWVKFGLDVSVSEFLFFPSFFLSFFFFLENKNLKVKTIFSSLVKIQLWFFPI